MTYDLIQFEGMVLRCAPAMWTTRIDEADTEYGVVVTKRGQAFQFERPSSTISRRALT
jgi:hypothetical protein